MSSFPSKRCSKEGIVSECADAGNSYIVFISNLVIKNRIDPERMKVTLSKLKMAVARMLHGHIRTQVGK